MPKQLYAHRGIRHLVLVRALCAALVLGVPTACSPTQADLRAVTYAPQVQSDWPVSTPAGEGLDPMLVAEFVYDAGALKTLYGLAVVKNDKLIAEKYFNGSSIDDANDRMSATKSVVSALTGLAIQRGCLPSIDQKVLDYFPEYAEQLRGQGKANVTVRDLLEMRAGYPWEENEPPYADLLYFKAQHNWLPRMVEFPLTHPGKFGYSNLTSHILGVVVARACKTELPLFAQKHLFGPMGAEVANWHRAADGYHFGAFGLFITLREMAKFGSVYMHSGQYRGKQLIAPEWVKASLQSYSTGINFTGIFSSWLGKYFRDLGYGYQWWSARVAAHQFDFAWGHGGNLIVLLHDLNTSIVTAADPLYDSPGELGWSREGAIIDTVGKFIESLPPATDS